MKTAGRQHAELILVSSKTFPQDRAFTGALVDALAALPSKPDGIGPTESSSSVVDPDVPLVARRRPRPASPRVKRALRRCLLTGPGTVRVTRGRRLATVRANCVSSADARRAPAVESGRVGRRAGPAPCS